MDGQPQQQCDCCLPAPESTWRRCWAGHSSFLPLFLMVVKMHGKFTILTILNVQFSGIRYIPTVVIASPASIHRTFSSCKIETLYRWDNNPTFPCPLRVPGTVYFFVPISPNILDTSCKWVHMVFVLLWLAIPFSIISSRFILVTSVQTSFLFNIH